MKIKRIMTIVTALVLVMSATAFSSVSAVMAVPVAENSHDHSGYAAWSDSESLPSASGSYYLTCDIVLSDAWSVYGGEFDICLNGHSITSTEKTKPTIAVYSGHVSVDGGTIGGGYDAVSNRGTLDVSDVIIIGDRSGISVEYGGNVTVKSTTINVKENGIYISTSYSSNDYCAAVIEDSNIHGGIYGIDNYRSFVTVDNSTVSGGGSDSAASNQASGVNNSSGTLTVTGGSVSGQNYGIYNSHGEITVNDADISGEKYSGIDNSAGSVTLNGGSVSGKDKGINTYNAGSVTINDGTVNGSTALTADSSDGVPSTLNIFSGIISGDYAGISSSGIVNISGGIVSGKTYGIDNTGALTVNGAEIENGQYGISNRYSGVVTVEDATIDAEDCGIYNADGNVMVKSGNISGKIYGINNSGVLTVEGGTISGGKYSGILSNGTLTVEGGTVTGDTAGIIGYETYTVTGGTVIGEEQGIFNEGDLFVTGGTITGKKYNGIYNNNTVTINDGTITGIGYDGIYNVKGTVTVNGGSVIGEGSNGISNYDILTIEGGTVVGGINGIYNTDFATATVNGGSVSGGDYGAYNFDEYSPLSVFGLGTVIPNSETVTYGGVEDGDGGSYKRPMSTLIVTGGSVSGTSNSGVYSNGTFKLSGDAEISGSSADIALGSGSYITVIGKLENKAPYTVSVADLSGKNDAVFTDTESTELEFNDPEKFAPAEELAELGYTVIKNDDQQLELEHDRTQTVPGDLNGDGNVDVQDGVLMQRILANLESNEEYRLRADLNGDGNVDVQDGVKMQRILANLE